MMKEGDIVLTQIMQSDGTFKMRPALILKVLPKYNDFLVCGISSQIHQSIDGFDYIIYKNSNDFLQSGLLKSSVIRLSFLSTIPTYFIEGKIGKIDKTVYSLLLERLCSFLSNIE